MKRPQGTLYNKKKMNKVSGRPVTEPNGDRMVNVDEKYTQHPMYQNVGRIRLQCLEDYLQLGAMMWARHHDITLPIRDPELREQVEMDLGDFREWLMGNVDNFQVIEGGRDKIQD